MGPAKYKKIAKEGTFLHDYMEYNSETETPYDYDFWTGLWILSCVLGRSLYVDRPMAPVRLNMYMILVAESGVTRKSTSVRKAVKFVRSYTQNTLIESKITPEKLEAQLALQTADKDKDDEEAESTAIIAIDELVKFLGKEQYTRAMPALLTDLYDAPDARSGGGTMARGITDIRNVFVSFLSASTPSWLLRTVNTDVIQGGFTSRVMFIVSERPKKSVPWPKAPSDELFATITANLSSIKRQASDVEFISISDAARSRFSTWYKRRELRRDTFRSSWQSREDAHVLKVAALLCINEGIWIIQNSHIINAIKLVEQTKEWGASIFEGTGTATKEIIGIDKLRDKLIALGHNGATQTVLSKSTSRYFNSEFLGTVLEVMHELDMVQKFENIKPGSGRGRPITIWRATKTLVGSKALDEIIGHITPE